MRFTASALCLALLPWGGGPVHAHSWYPYDCCSDRDCWPMGLDADAREPDPASSRVAISPMTGITWRSGTHAPRRTGASMSAAAAGC